MGHFAGQCALITGGGTGLGLAIARQFAGQGADLVLVSRSQDHLDQGRAALADFPVKVGTYSCDVRDYRAVRRTLKKAENDGFSPNLLVNNAAGNFVRPAEKLPEKAFATVTDIVLNGSFYLSRNLGDRWIERGTTGCILNILATYAWTGGPGTVHSACAKAGVLAMTRTLAVEWAKYGIRVVGVAPGPFDSTGAADRLWPSEAFESRVREGIPLKRFASREEVAEACVWLMSDKASYITGECLTMDGGAWLGKGILGSSNSDEPIPVIKRRKRKPTRD